LPFQDREKRAAWLAELEALGPVEEVGGIEAEQVLG